MRILYTALLLGFMAQAQEPYFSVYVPLHTTHLETKHSHGEPIGFHNGFLGSQGGQGGLLISYNTHTSKETIKTHTVGIAQNSYGDAIGILSIGRVKSLRGLRFGWEAGITTGYAKSFKREVNRIGVKNDLISEFATKYKVLPIVTGTVGYNITKRFGLKAIVNPIYVNVGLNYQFK